MAGKFVADPMVLRREGQKLVEQGERFDHNVVTVYETLDEMLSSSYLSPAAQALGTKILSYRDTLDEMTKTINQYGTFCQTASSKVTANEDNIIDTFSGR